MAKKKQRRLKTVVKAPTFRTWWQIPSPYNPYIRSKKEIQAEAAKRREREAKHRIIQAIPGITDLVEQGHLLVTESFMKMVTHPWQKERLIRAVVMGKLKRE